MAQPVTMVICVYNIDKNTWYGISFNDSTFFFSTYIYSYIHSYFRTRVHDSSQKEYNAAALSEEPQPRYAHQLVVNNITNVRCLIFPSNIFASTISCLIVLVKTSIKLFVDCIFIGCNAMDLWLNWIAPLTRCTQEYFLFGGNPRDKNTQYRLNDLWLLSFKQNDTDTILTRILLAIRSAKWVALMEWGAVCFWQNYISLCALLFECSWYFNYHRILNYWAKIIFLIAATYNTKQYIMPKR